MNRGWKILSVVVLGVVLPLGALAQEGNLRYSITVTKFENESGWRGQWDIGSAWDTVLTDMLSQTTRCGQCAPLGF